MIDTRAYFRPLVQDLSSLLRGLDGDDWLLPTMAGHWRVRDVTAHLIDTALRRLSFQRDGLKPPSPAPGEAFASFINRLNAVWVESAERLSPRVLGDLYAVVGLELAEFFETLDPYEPAFFPVSWAGQTTSPQWLDVGREFTEVWHHGSQIRDAVGDGPWPDARWLHAVLRLGMLAVPPAYQDVPAHAGTAIVIKVTGPASGVWTLSPREGAWTIDEGASRSPAATVTMADEVAWRLLFNALTPDRARNVVAIDGDETLAFPLLRVRSVIVCPST